MLEADFQRIDEECNTMLKEINEIIGNLSDLRYGKFEREGMAEALVTEMENLQEVCEDVLAA